MRKKNGPEKLCIRTLFTQWVPSNVFYLKNGWSEEWFMVNLAVDDRKSDYDKINNVFYSHLLRGLLFPKDKESERERESC